MSDGIRVEVHVRGCLGGDLLDLVAASRSACGAASHRAHRARRRRPRPGRPVHALERAGVELEEVISQPG